jgi:hypothetical protein
LRSGLPVMVFAAHGRRAAPDLRITLPRWSGVVEPSMLSRIGGTPRPPPPRPAADGISLTVMTAPHCSSSSPREPEALTPPGPRKSGRQHFLPGVSSPILKARRLRRAVRRRFHRQRVSPPLPFCRTAFARQNEPPVNPAASSICVLHSRCGSTGIRWTLASAQRAHVPLRIRRGRGEYRRTAYPSGASKRSTVEHCASAAGGLQQLVHRVGSENW